MCLCASGDFKHVSRNAQNASRVTANRPWLSIYHIQAPAVLQICHRAASKSRVNLCNLSHREQQLKEEETMSVRVVNGVAFHFLTSFEPDKEMDLSDEKISQCRYVKFVTH